MRDVEVAENWWAILSSIPSDAFPVEIKRGGQVVGYFVTPERMESIREATNEAMMWRLTHKGATIL